jgi:16S rRNA (cytosine967-C5)-methyltransferase
MLAFQILLQLERNVSHPDRLIRTVLERHSGLEPRDRALLTELVYGTLRWQGRLDWHIDQLSAVKPQKIAQPVRILLRLALYQLLILERIPEHAAVNETVKIARATQPSYLSGFINAILREAIRRKNQWEWPDPKENPEEHLAVMTSHPRWFVRRLLAPMGFDETRELCTANNSVAPMALRVNTLKTKPSEAIEWLREKGVDATLSPYFPESLRLTGLRQDVTHTELYERGAIQIQDEASQLIARIMAPEPGDRVLDLCAGFGGKSTHLAILMKNRGEIVSVDEAAWKLEDLRRNALRQGVGIIRTVTADVRELSSEQLGCFDRVLLDAPCSGFGVLRRNPDIKWRRHPKDPYRFSQIQEALLRHGAGFVKKGGALVYATCTIFREENEEVAERFSASHPQWTVEPVEPLLPESCRAMTSGPFFRSWTHRHGIDGFFAARWVRRE